jgi:serine/threonine protein kinase
VDIYSIGVIIYNIVFGKPLVTGKTVMDVIRATNKLNIKEMCKKLKCSKSIKDLLSKLLCPNPIERFDAQEALNHEWFKNDIPALKYSLFIN